MESFVTTNTPALMEYFQHNWGTDIDGNSTTSIASPLSIASLRRVFAESIVRVSVSDSGRFDGPEDGSLWGLSADTEVLVR